MGGVAGAPDAEGADAKFDVRLDLVNLSVQALDEIVDVHAAPVAAFHVAAKFFPARIIRERRAFGIGVRVKIIIDVNAIDIVPAYHVEHHFERVGCGGGFSGIQPLVAIIGFYEGRLSLADVVGRGGALGGLVTGPIRVEPCVQFQPVFVRFGNGVGERIPCWLRSLAHLAG